MPESTKGKKTYEGICKSILFFNLIVLIGFVIAYVGIAQSERGRHYMMEHSCEARVALLESVPEPSNRGYLWYAIDILLRITTELPLFLSGRAERGRYFELAATACGPVFPFVGGVALTKYADVAPRIQAEQSRGPFFASHPVAEGCLADSSLIFQSGPEHAKIRSFLEDALKGLKVEGENLPTLVGLDKLKLDPSMSAATKEKVISSVLVQSMYQHFFGTSAADELVETLLKYIHYSKWCILDNFFHTITFKVILEKVDQARSKTLEASRDTPHIQLLTQKAKSQGMDSQQIESLLESVIDGFMFAGLIGTDHLTHSVLKRIQSSPLHHLKLWQTNPVAFMLEQSRLDPPVTSVTIVLEDETQFDLGRSGERPIVLAAGSTVQLIIATANRDPRVFGGESRSSREARAFDPLRVDLDKILTFHAPEADISAAKARRACPGRALALQFTQLVVDAFKPSQEEAKAWLIHAGGEQDEYTLDRLVEQGNRQSALSMRSDQVKYVFHTNSSLDRIGYVIWGVCCLLSVIYLRFASDWGVIAQLYAVYLGAQFWVSVGHVFVSARPIYYLGTILAALAYYLLYLHYANKASFFRRMIVYAAAVCYASIIIFCIYHFGSDYSPKYLMRVAASFYSPAAMSGIYTVYRAWIDSGKDWAETVGLVGGCFGIANLFWPFMIGAPAFSSLISRVADSTLYVPLMLNCVIEMDEQVTERESEQGENVAKWWRRFDANKKPKKKLNFTRFLIVSSLFLAIIGGVVTGRGASGFADGSVCPTSEPGDEHHTAHQYGCNHSILSNVEDIHLKIWYKIIKGLNVNYKGESQPPASDVPIPSEPPFEMPKKELHFGVAAPYGDNEDSPVATYKEAFGVWMQDAFAEVMMNGLLFPIVDVDMEWDNMEEAKHVMRAASQTGWDLPRPNKDWSEIDMTSDIALTHMAMSGVAAHHLTKVNSKAFLTNVSPNVREMALQMNCSWLVDFSWMVVAPVREGFERYGATAFFDEDVKIMKIYSAARDELITPGDKGWDHAKFAWRTSVVTGVTATDHLIGIHLMMANFVVISSRENLGIDHPLRRLLKPFSYRTLMINRAACIHLVTKNGILHRTVSLTWEGVKGLFKHSFHTNRFAPVGDYFKDRGLDTIGPNHAISHDLSDYTKIVSGMVEEYVYLYYPSEKTMHRDVELRNFWDDVRWLEDSTIPQLKSRQVLVDFISQFILYVTAIHHHVGNVAEYLTDARVASGKIRPNRDLGDVQASFQSMLIALLTGRKQPGLIDDYTHLLLHDEHLPKTKAIWDRFQNRLTKLADTIDQRNDQRPYKTDAIHPRYLLSSVSI